MEKYKFKIENETYEWENQIITGAEVRSIGPGIPENMDLFLKTQGNTGLLIKNEDEVDLGEQGIEKFYVQDSSSEAG